MMSVSINPLLIRIYINPPPSACKPLMVGCPFVASPIYGAPNPKKMGGWNPIQSPKQSQQHPAKITIQTPQFLGSSTRKLLHSDRRVLTLHFQKASKSDLPSGELT